ADRTSRGCPSVRVRLWCRGSPGPDRARREPMNVRRSARPVALLLAAALFVGCSKTHARRDPPRGLPSPGQLRDADRESPVSAAIPAEVAVAPPRPDALTGVIPPMPGGGQPPAVPASLPGPASAITPVGGAEESAADG